MALRGRGFAERIGDRLRMIGPDSQTARARDTRMALGARRAWYPASAAATPGGPAQSLSASASAAASSIAWQAPWAR